MQVRRVQTTGANQSKRKSRGNKPVDDAMRARLRALFQIQWVENSFS